MDGTGMPGRAGPRARMRPFTVVVADSSVVLRGLLGRWLGEAQEFRVVATAGDGESALADVARHRPHVLILDLDLPGIDGVAALSRIMRQSPDTAVLVCTGLDAEAARLALQCMTLGAADILPRPASRPGVTISQDFKADLFAKLRHLTQGERKPQGLLPASAGSDLRPLVATSPRYLLIGASTGGPHAIARVLCDMGSSLADVSTLVVQHMPPLFTASFAERVGSQIDMPAREPHDGEQLARGTVYIAPGGRHLGIARRLGHLVASVTDGPPVSFCRPAVDVLFRDAARHIGSAAIGLVLTGMGSDGTEGAAALRRAGAAVIAQDEASSTVWGMPGSVVKAGHASAVLPLSTVGPALRALLRGGTRA